MVHKKKRHTLPKNYNEHISVNDFAVEIKQEEELIIEEDARNVEPNNAVQWSFIGMEEADGLEEQELYNEFNQSGMSNFELDVIEIDDCSDNIEVSNEPIDETSFLLQLQSEGSGNLNNLPQGDTDNELDIDTKEFISVLEPKNDLHASITIDENDENDHTAETTTTINKEETNLVSVHKLLASKSMKMQCPWCSDTFPYVKSWQRHCSGKRHEDLYAKMMSNFKPISSKLASCKLCKYVVIYRVNQMIHIIQQHWEIAPKIFQCTLCKYKDSDLFAFEKHQNNHFNKRHENENDSRAQDIETSNTKAADNHAQYNGIHEECPKCAKVFNSTSSLEFHFSSHTREFSAKFKYICHLCNNLQFENNKKSYYAHLVHKHKLTTWKALKFNGIDSNRHIRCIECFKIFVNPKDTNKILTHYLTHSTNCFWSCRFCETRQRYTDWPSLHLCKAMKEYYRNKNSSRQDEIDSKKSIQKITNWHDFEVNVKHVCPFCKTQFEKFDDWRLHLRETHYIHTLEGLNMAIIPDVLDELKCLQCFKNVPKSAIELHKHRFEHLPHQPYQCRFCLKSMATYNLALNHVSTGCENESKPNISNSGENSSQADIPVSEKDLLSLISIYCTLCNNKRFPDSEAISKHFRNFHGNFEKYFIISSKDNKRTCKICQSVIRKCGVISAIDHYLQHLDEKPYKCQICSRSYPIIKQAMQHISTYHGTCLSEKSLKKEKVEKTVKEEESNDCLKHNEEPKQQKPPESVIQALPKALMSLTEKSKVYRAYEKFISYVCPECGITIPTMELWESHVHTTHTFFHTSNLCVRDPKNGKSKCNICNIQVQTLPSWQRRHKLTHMPYSPFVCSLCDARFKQVSHLYSHFRKFHRQEISSQSPHNGLHRVSLQNVCDDVKIEEGEKQKSKDNCLDLPTVGKRKAKSIANCLDLPTVEKRKSKSIDNCLDLPTVGKRKSTNSNPIDEAQQLSPLRKSKRIRR